MFTVRVKSEKVFVTFIIYWLLYVLCVLCTQTYNIFNRWEPLIAPICTMIRSSAYHCCVCVCVCVCTTHTPAANSYFYVFFFKRSSVSEANRTAT